MSDDRIIRGDLDRVYDDPTAVCHKITSYIYSKGDIKTNKVSNKFCNIEILQANGLSYLVITSGRLGAADNNIVVRRLNSENVVKKLYLEECKKRMNSGYQEVEVISIYPNCSAAAKNFVSEKNVLSEEEAKEIAVKKSNIKTTVSPTEKTKKEKKLNSKVSSLVESIYEEANQTIKKSLSPESFKRSGTPLGMINLNMVQRGREILKNISEIQNKMVKIKGDTMPYLQKIAELSNMYNTTIPRVIGRGSSDWLLETGDKLAEQYELLDILEVGLSNAVLNSSFEVDTVSKYKSLNTEISLVTDKDILNNIVEKMKREQLHNHHLKTRLVNAYEINQLNAPNFDNSCGNVVSLFHGTRGANLLGILSTHIKLPTNLGSNIQLTGSMFGPGVYFGEYSKSLQYSTSRFGGTRNKGRRYYLFICDVALGKMKMVTQPQNFAKSPSGFNSVMGVGDDGFRYGCNINGIGGTKDLVMSKSVFNNTFRSTYSSLMHNEFIVYNQNRYKIRYLIEVEEIR